jgi:hypothetical protein
MIPQRELELIEAAQKAIPFLIRRMDPIIPKDHFEKAIDCLEKFKEDKDEIPDKPIDPTAGSVDL